MKKYWLMVTAIPTVFAVGIVLFFVLLPPELVTLVNFIAYASSLSTIIMVLVYVFTTSLQLRAMQNQLTEMQYSRNVQVQPLIYPREPKVELELSRYYAGPSSNFEKMELMCRILVDFRVINLGNGPAVEADFIPKLVSIDNMYILSRFPEKKAVTLIDGLGARVECISLKEGDTKEIHFLFLDKEHKLVESLLQKRGEAHLTCVVTLKNVLGMTFKEVWAFRIDYPSTAEETLKLCLKTAKTAEIDFGDRVKEFESLKLKGKDDEAERVFEELKEGLKARFKGCQDNIVLDADVAAGSFSIAPISQSEYEKLLSEKKRTLYRIALGSETDST